MLRSAVAALALLVAAPAASTPFTATLTTYVFSKQQPMPAVLSASGSGVSAPGLVALPGGLFLGTATATTPTTLAPPVTGNELVVSGNGPGSFSGTPLAGAMPFQGHLSYIGLGGLELFRVPLSVLGVPGASATWAKGGFSLTAVGAAWTTGFVAVNVPTPMGGVITSSFYGYDNRVNGIGSLLLVSPILITSNLGGPSLVWNTLHVSFVPEPGTLALLAAGSAALAAVGRRRARARAPSRP